MVETISQARLRRGPAARAEQAVYCQNRDGYEGQGCCLEKSGMIMIAFITIKSSLVPLIEGLCAQI